MSDVQGFHINTPLLESISMSKLLGSPVYLKMESSQPSGGNAGLATVYAARKLKLPATIIVPSSSPELVVEKLKNHGARVRVVGKVWDEANAEALRLAESEKLTFVHPFDHPLIWKGHSSLIHELKASLPCEPGAVVLSVGGGGLFCGVVQGMDEVGWGSVPILCIETVGADCLNAAIKAGRLVTLPAITSEAKCLGAMTACTQAFEYSKRSNVISEVVTDQQALEALELFLDEERVFVEMACAASLAAVYTGVIQRLQGEGRLPKPLGPLVLIVCGGSSVNMAQLQHLRAIFK